MPKLHKVYETFDKAQAQDTILLLSEMGEHGTIQLDPATMPDTLDVYAVMLVGSKARANELSYYVEGYWDGRKDQRRADNVVDNAEYRASCRLDF